MITISRFDSFSLAKQVWHELESKTVQYPFQSFWYQQIFAQRFCNPEDVYLLGVYEDQKVLAIGGFERVKDTMLFLGMKQVLGGQDITDYGDLLFLADLTDRQVKEIWQAIMAYFDKQQIDKMQLDFVREDSKTYQVLKGFQSAFVTTSVDKQEVAPYITVSPTWDAYLEMLSRKDRHELKRKIKRLEEQQAFHFCSHETIHDDFEIFIRLHRLSDPDKETFMSEEMKAFFWDIVSADKTNYRIDFCFLKMDGKAVSSIMSFIGQGKALLYNSGFDPAYSQYSVGLILHAYLIKKSIEEKLTVHDFLRGNERYKYDLGAKDAQLYRLTVFLQR